MLRLVAGTTVDGRSLVEQPLFWRLPRFFPKYDALGTGATVDGHSLVAGATVDGLSATFLGLAKVCSKICRTWVLQVVLR